MTSRLAADQTASAASRAVLPGFVVLVLADAAAVFGGSLAVQRWAVFAQAGRARVG